MAIYQLSRTLSHLIGLRKLMLSAALFIPMGPTTAGWDPWPADQPADSQETGTRCFCSHQDYEGAFITSAQEPRTTQDILGGMSTPLIVANIG